MRILVIDDEAFALKVLAHQLVALGQTHVKCYEHAADALRSLQSGHDVTDLIFCDLHMPEIDGVEFVRHLAGMDYRGGLVLVSGQSERILQAAKRLAKAHELNVLGALRKPVLPGQLQQLLQRNAMRATVLPRADRQSYGAEALRRAIDNGELLNHYQPQVDIASGAVTGIEALVRWQHPEDGLLFPDQFIHVAEQSGLIDRLAHAVLKTSLGHARQWHDTGLRLQVSVNVSMNNLASLDFPDLVERTATDAGLSVTSLMLEVTESQLMKDPLASMEILTRLRIKRISLSIDDFGTGHSSLAQLRDIPFNELKVDRGFVHGAWRDDALRAIVEATLAMARQLGMKVVAEGVEDRDDWDFLRAIGCDLAQGWFIAKPMPAEELPDWIEGWESRRAGLTGRAVASTNMYSASNFQLQSLIDVQAYQSSLAPEPTMKSDRSSGEVIAAPKILHEVRPRILLALDDPSQAQGIEDMLERTPAIPVDIRLAESLYSALQAHARGVPFAAPAETGAAVEGSATLDHLVKARLERKRAADTLRESEERYRGLLEISPHAVLVHSEGELVLANDAAVQLLGASEPQELIGRPFLDFVHAKDRAAVQERPGGGLFARTRLIRLDRTVVDIEWTASACGYLGKPAVQLLIRDGTERRQLESRLSHLAQYDMLTELPNRSQFRDRLGGAMARASRNQQLLGLMYLGLDRFQSVNAALGQGVGDLVLKQMADRLKRCVRKSDTVARLGGDMFCAILEGVAEKQGAAVVAQRVLESLSQPMQFDGQELRLTASIGLAVFPLDASELDALLHNAELAMHDAKDRGRGNCQFYAPELDARVRRHELQRAEIEQRLARLTPREHEVLDLLVAGKANKMAAHLLGTSTRTIENHRARIMDKMQADSLPDLVRMVLERRLA